MTTCLAIGATVLHLVTPTFTLSWTHSVEHARWEEDWRVSDTDLYLIRARVKGSGAGMEPGEGAVLRNGWWEWDSALTAPTLTLAASGATGGGWTICAGGNCSEIGADDNAPITLGPCE